MLALWHRRAQGHPAIGLGQTGFHSAVEATSASDGRFKIPARVFVNVPPFFPIEGPEIALFKAGYGGWKSRSPSRDLAAPGVVIEMRPLTTDAERKNYLDGKWPAADRRALSAWQHGERPENPYAVPYEAAARYEAAINLARATLGLRPIGIGFPHLSTEYFSPTPDELPGQARLRQAHGVAVDTKGYVDRDTVYVADWGNRRVQRFTTDGRFLGKWGELRANELGGTFTPTMIATTRSGELVVYAGSVYQGSVYVMDLKHDRPHKLPAPGR